MKIAALILALAMNANAKPIKSPEQIHAEAGYAVKIKSYKIVTVPITGQQLPIAAGFGSGSIVKCRKYEYCVLTAFHVVKDSSMTYFAEFQDNSRPQMLELVSGTTTYDVALMRFKDKTFKPKHIAELGASSLLRPGSPIYPIGSNLFGDFWISSGRLYAAPGPAQSQLKQVLESYKADHPEILIFNSPLFHGFSGGPLHNKYGEVIGVSVMMFPLDMEPIYIGTPIDKIRTVLKDLK